MEVINNIDKLLGDDLKPTLQRGARVSIAASYFSIYAYEALKKELEGIQDLQFIFTSRNMSTLSRKQKAAWSRWNCEILRKPRFTVPGSILPKSAVVDLGMMWPKLRRTFGDCKASHVK